jgi:hypothetical protein
MNQYSIRGCRLSGAGCRMGETNVIWDEESPEFFAVYSREPFDDLETHLMDFDTRAEANVFIEKARNPMNIVIMNGVVAKPTIIPNAWQEDQLEYAKLGTQKSVLELEQENADLKLQLEKSMIAQLDLKTALDKWLEARKSFRQKDAAVAIGTDVYEKMIEAVRESANDLEATYTSSGVKP